ncbi:MAG: phosphoribosyltransferase family protein [Verrucomicrobiota bacterium]
MDLHFRWARAAVASEGIVRGVIHRYKYNSARWFEPFLAGLLIRQAAPTLRGGEWDMIVPVPLFKIREREREFNQSERLARRLAEAVSLPVRTDLLVRTQPTMTQTKLTRTKRAENVRDAFGLREGARLQGERVVVVDDVLTTGATTSACAKILRSAGAGDVCVWTVARGL